MLNSKVKICRKSFQESVIKYFYFINSKTFPQCSGNDTDLWTT